jgi:hypothetical protein
LGTRLGVPPPEYLRYRLRMMYHCTPSEFEKQKGAHLFEMLRDLACLNMEIKVGNIRHG